MPGLSEIMKSHPGLVWGVAGGAVLGVGYILVKGKGQSGGQASAFPPQYTLGGVTQGGASVPPGNNGTAVGCPTGYHLDGSSGQCVPNNVGPHPGPLPGPTPNPGPEPVPFPAPPSPHPGPLPGPQPNPGGGTGDFNTPTIAASQGLYSNVLSAVSAQNSMNMSE